MTFKLDWRGRNFDESDRLLLGHGSYGELTVGPIGDIHMSTLKISRDPTVCGCAHLGGFSGTPQLEGNQAMWRQGDYTIGQYSDKDKSQFLHELKNGVEEVLIKLRREYFGMVEITFNSSFTHLEDVCKELGFKLVTTYLNHNSRRELRVYHKVLE